MKKKRKEVGEEDEKEGEKQARQQTKDSPTQGNGGWGEWLDDDETNRSSRMDSDGQSERWTQMQENGWFSFFIFFFFFTFSIFPLSGQRPPYTASSVPYLPSPFPSMYWEGLTEKNSLRIEPWNPECTVPSCESMIL